ncbi:hypothetical protein A2482_02290 [Candidatus Falkowbacteria bacterium RIFOXYC2_FULL_48_21]|uniref:Uncharacterized protein n=1 Tax=Candidatus Falkowbacteria bacterium RIFOXYC2_FULL_48_21 TaxID=1798005 RepID=A0A1F5TG45_9BACT|nr:MAG: hypothetical protein A2482_02290 [Candidatus Falkowbacteria bacterium RIFOXYC2_FULL_48_21]
MMSANSFVVISFSIFFYFNNMIAKIKTSVKKDRDSLINMIMRIIGLVFLLLTYERKTPRRGAGDGC